MSPEAAIILGLHRRDGTTQEIATTIPLAAVAGDRISGEGEVLPRIKLACN